MKQNGFTLVELITVIILLGILSAVALPRFFDSNTFSDSFDRNDLESALSWTRNRAITSQCAYEFRITSFDWSVFKDTTCGSTVSEPACATGIVYDFANKATANNSQPLSGDAPVSTNGNKRLIFTETGQIFEPTNLPAITACTELESEPVEANSSYPLSTGTLNIDGETAYVEVR